MHAAEHCEVCLQREVAEITDPTVIVYDSQNCPSCLIGWISDTLSQGYTDLQSLLKCPDHRVSY